MKYENFEKVKTLMREIKALEESIQEIQESAEYVIIQGNNEDLDTVGLKENKDKGLVELAKDYIKDVIQHYEMKIYILKNEIEEL